MAIFDPVEQRLCIRIVYDGVGGAGKTTNLKALCGLFATRRTTELFSPGEVEGRTLYFDWVQIMAGSICGFPLMCQIISVPGQTVLTPRRRHLLSTADVVVFVCDSNPAGIERARKGLALLEELGRPVPLIVQANKQDQVQAMPGRDVVAALGRDVSVVEAIATEGVGVIDTFVNAVRIISKKMQCESDAGTLQVDVARAPAAADELEKLKGQTLDPEWAAEMFLEEAQAAFLIDGGFARPPVEVMEARRFASPTFPQPDVETGFVWPAHTGRLVLKQLRDKARTLWTEHAASSTLLTPGADGTCDVVVEGRWLRTRCSLRFEDREEARHALVRAARERTQLDQTLASDTVLVLQVAADGAWWLWTVMSAAERLPEALANVEDRRPLLELYAAALVDVVRTAMHKGFAVDLGPSSFGLVGGHVHYVGDVGNTDPGATVEGSVVEAIKDVERRGWESAVFLEAFEREISCRLTPEEAARANAARRKSQGSASGVLT